MEQTSDLPRLNKDLLQSKTLDPFFKRGKEFADAQKIQGKRIRTVDALVAVAQTAEERAVANLAKIKMEQAGKAHEPIGSTAAVGRALEELLKDL